MNNIKEDLHLAFKDDNNIGDASNLTGMSDIDMDEIINLVKDFLDSKKTATDSDDEFGGSSTPNSHLDDLDDLDHLDDLDDNNFELDADSEQSDIFSDLDDTSNFDSLDSDSDINIDSEIDVDDSDDDFQGDIRTVQGAKLIYKRKMEDGTFEELWIYNVGKDIKSETNIRRAILAGTDINPSTNTDESGEQTADVATVGNVQFLHITGIQN